MLNDNIGTVILFLFGIVMVVKSWKMYDLYYDNMPCSVGIGMFFIGSLSLGWVAGVVLMTMAGAA